MLLGGGGIFKDTQDEHGDLEGILGLQNLFDGRGFSFEKEGQNWSIPAAAPRSGLCYLFAAPAAAHDAGLADKFFANNGADINDSINTIPIVIINPGIGTSIVDIRQSITVKIFYCFQTNYLGLYNCGWKRGWQRRI